VLAVSSRPSNRRWLESRSQSEGAHRVRLAWPPWSQPSPRQTNPPGSVVTSLQAGVAHGENPPHQRRERQHALQTTRDNHAPQVHQMLPFAPPLQASITPAIGPLQTIYLSCEAGGRRSGVWPGDRKYGTRHRAVAGMPLFPAPSPARRQAHRLPRRSVGLPCGAGVMGCTIRWFR
jgi:hypothetical protein